MLSAIVAHLRQKYHPLWRLRKSSGFRRFQKWIDFPVYTSIPETHLKVAVKCIRDSSWIWSPQGIEPEIRLAFHHVLAHLQPRTFWDIGANIGFYSWIVRQADSIDHVVMFEPDPTNYALIFRTLKANSLSDCRVMNVAMAGHDGQATFLVDHASGATGSLESTASCDNPHSLQHAYGMSETITCRTVTMDRVIAEGVPAPDFIKVDVEGAELLVLSGGMDLLRGSHPTMVIETGNEDVINQLKEIGYATFQIDQGNWLFIKSGREHDVFTALKDALDPPKASKSDGELSHCSDDGSVALAG
jgi:FkbM family methyltransferase